MKREIQTLKNPHRVESLHSQQPPKPAPVPDGLEWAEIAIPVTTIHTAELPAALHPDTAQLVIRFAEALAAKLTDAQEKHGYTNGWKDPLIVGDLQRQLVEHVRKGDPRDVAAYCAMLWHHNAPTNLDKWVPAEDYEAACVTRVALKQNLADAFASLRRQARTIDEQERAIAEANKQCRSAPQAIAVIQNALANTGACISIWDGGAIEVVFGESSDALRCLPGDLPEVLEALAVIHQHQHHTDEG